MADQPATPDGGMPPIVGVDWLQANLDAVTVCDVRSPRDGHAPRALFSERHLRGAIFVDLDTVLAAAPAAVVGRHPLPDPASFADALGAIGVRSSDRVVAYDEMGGAFASRLVWMLRVIGQPAALLDGGLAAWPGPYGSGISTPEAVEREPVDWPSDALADADDVARHLGAGGVVIDSRAPERYRGEVEPLDAVAGHIPGAVNLPFAGNLDERGRFNDIDQLRARFVEHGGDGSASEPTPVDGDAIVYCGSGVTACHNALAIEAAGLGRPRVYVGSWSGWSTDPTRAIATGAEPGDPA